MTSTGCSPCKGRVRAFCAGVGVVACLGLATQVVAAGEPASPPAARSAVVQTRLAQLQSQVTLYKTLGGGWTEPAGNGQPVSTATLR